MAYKVRPCLKIIREQRKISYGEKERGKRRKKERALDREGETEG